MRLFRVLLEFCCSFCVFFEMDNFKALKKWDISGGESPEESSSTSGSSSSSVRVIRVRPKEVLEGAKDKSAQPDKKRVVVVIPDESTSSVIDYLEQRYPEVSEWSVQRQIGAREQGLQEECKSILKKRKKKPWWKKIFFFWKK
ncbi:uncharacterized protein LOC111638593 [Centruroides sculpturatus]|uniref:uncharacterized protein LOC111638593 n=1 Tax=Centruroides sculpturatus TaxID=218467 RepID=UPI000C6DF84D|nr:uncharacterized protein LOC111638593 [Centruroides sculpturatus]